MSTFTVAALYKFVELPDFVEKQDPLKELCQKQSIKGTLLLAREGINGTIAGSREAIDALLNFLKSDPRLQDLEHKESLAKTMPFKKMKVRLKKEIVTIGIPEADPTKKVGTYVKPEDWNNLISDPDVTIIDTRNDYEVEIGTFKGAINPKTESFREFPDYIRSKLDPQRQKKVALFCTGGIRCEKASSLMIHLGFKEVYHLQGGILKYLEKVPESKSLWQGECFVFDGRVSVADKLKPGTYRLCFSCQYPVSERDLKSPKYREGICCPRCFDQLTEDKYKRVSERQHQIELKKKTNSKSVFKKKESDCQ
jgi:UPF0176 protein